MARLRRIARFALRRLRLVSNYIAHAMKTPARLFTCLTAMLASQVAAEEPNAVQSASQTQQVLTVEPADTTRRGYWNFVGITATYLFADENRAPQIDDGNGVSVLVGQRFDSGLGWEGHFSVDAFETGVDGTTDFYRQTLGLDLTYSFGGREQFTPFVLLGGGYSHNDVFPDERDDQAWNANAGLGFVTPPIAFDNLHLRVDARYIRDEFEDVSEDYRVAVGLEMQLFSEPPEPVTVVREKVRVVEVPIGFSDSDGDGVVDPRDRCPDTRAGERVDGEGCALPRIITLKGVNFETASSHLRQDSRGILDETVETVKRHPDIQFEVAGHTDNQGSERYNQQLSRARAQSVREYLVSKGVNAAQLSVAGYGESQPVASNDSAAGREENRRVELRTRE